MDWKATQGGPHIHSAVGKIGSSNNPPRDSAGLENGWVDRKIGKKKKSIRQPNLFLAIEKKQKTTSKFPFYVFKTRFETTKLMSKM